jgi:hypothetical protein
MLFGLQEPLAGVPFQVRSGCCGPLVVLLLLLEWAETLLMLVQVLLQLLHRLKVQLHGPASMHDGARPRLTWISFR